MARNNSNPGHQYAVGDKISLNSLVCKSDGTVVSLDTKPDSVMVVWDNQETNGKTPRRVLRANIRPRQ